MRQAYRFGNLQDFLNLYYQGMSVLVTEQDFYDLAWAYFERAYADNVRHAEMFFDPQAHTSRGVAFATVLDGLSRAIADAGRKLGVKASLIMCFLRHLDEADAERTLDCALPFKDRIVGVGLDSSERGNPPSKFKRVFDRAREAGFFLTAHAGEEGPPSYVWEALDVLGVARIDHGVRAIEDPDIVGILVDRQIPLGVCPTSNLTLGVYRAIEEHPIEQLRRAGVAVSINTDDPALLATSLPREYALCRDAFAWSDADVRSVARTSIDASFADEDVKTRLHHALSRW